MFVGDQHGKAEEAMNLYVSLFENSRILEIERYGATRGARGNGQAGDILVAGQEFIAMDSGRQHLHVHPGDLDLVNCDSERDSTIVRGSRTEERC